tara:strand:- start:5888 stop:6964 length:1077 start_codon:yes stop_codon:yes gene_type:complete
MRKGSVVGEYIIVAFFFMLILVGVVKVSINHASFEGNKISSDYACESAERLFRDVVDKEPAESNWKTSYNSFIGGSVSMDGLRGNWTHFGISGGNRYEVDYSALDFLINNVSIVNFTQYLNNGESFLLSYDTVGLDVNSIYSEKLTFGGVPTAQIWMNATSGVASDNVIHNVLGIAAGSNAVGARFETEIFFPNATIIGTHNSSLDSGDLVTISNGTDGATATVDFKIAGSDEDIVYVAYTVNDTSVAGWESTWTTGGATFFDVDKVVTKNNLIMVRNIEFKNSSLDKDYSVYLGNNTLAKSKFGAEQLDSSQSQCEYGRIYTIVGDRKQVNQSIVDSAHNIYVKPTFVSEIRVLISK